MQRMLTLLHTPNLRARSRIFGDLKCFTRLHFLYVASSVGLLQALKAPASKDELIKRLSVQRPELLESLLDLGVALKELNLTADGLYRITGRCSSTLSSDKEDPLVASIEEYVTIHSSVFRNLATRIRGESNLGEYLEDHGPLIARSSRITEPYLREFVKDIVREVKPKSMLEVGCGSGIYLKYAAEASAEIVGYGIDLQESVARQARANLLEWGISNRFKILVADIRRLPPELAGPFDLITLYNNVYYFSVEERTSLFHDLRSKLTPNGALAIVSLTQEKNRRSVTAGEFDLALRSTVGCASLPETNRLREQLMKSGFAHVKTEQLVPFEPYYGIITRL